ncbi:sensor histidine kinase [Nocardioides sp. GXQ0305]|uniref:sensor histidine kinase n=1 Tax=Nocardioides sp. GXQ0305 TaxID=3423912 RepID=UPI003D7ECF66
MTESTSLSNARARDDGWGYDGARKALRLIAEDARRRTDFRTCEIEVLRPDDMLEFVAIAGNDDADDEMLRRATPFSAMALTLGLGAEYGEWTFVAQEWLTREAVEQLRAYCWIPEIEDTGAPDQWRALDVLVARIVDDRGQLRALMYLDEPHSGRRPTPGELRRLDEDLRLVVRAVLTAIEREELSQQVRLTTTAQEVVRTASRRLGYRELLPETRKLLADGFRADDLAVLVHTDPPPDLDPGSPVRLPAGLLTAATDAARRAWRDQTVVIAEPGQVWGDDRLDAHHRAELTLHLVQHGAGALVLAPIGAGPEPLGLMLIARRVGEARWTQSESVAALEVGHDLGRAILNTRAHDRELQLIAELTRLDEHRSRLISTVAHELKNPLGVITGHLELLGGMADLTEPVGRSLTAMERSSARLRSLADDLLLLSRMETAALPPSRSRVPLAPILAEVVEDADLTSGADAPRIALGDHGAELAVAGDREELCRLVSNLVGNAVKYSRPGGEVRLALTRVGQHVVFECSDDGIGISTEDQHHLFSDFFRSTNPEALARPGTGLGLSIVHRIATRHGGRIGVTSELGVGTTFTVTLPAA